MPANTPKDANPKTKIIAHLYPYLEFSIEIVASTIQPNANGHMQRAKDYTHASKPNAVAIFIIKKYLFLFRNSKSYEIT